MTAVLIGLSSAFALGAVPAQAGQAAVGGKPAATGTPLVPDQRPQPAVQRVDLGELATGERCTPTPASSSLRAQGVAETCTKIVRSTTTAALVDPPTASCRTNRPGYWTYQRLSSCMKDMETTFKLKDRRGRTLGTGRMKVNTSMKLSASSGTWNENISVKLDKVTGQVRKLNVAFDAKCTSACSMRKKSPWSGAKTLTLGEIAKGKVTYGATPPSGRKDFLTTKYHMNVTMPGAIPVQPNVNWDNPRKIRCDNQITGSPGCVHADVRPNLVLSLSRYGAAAATYLWAQQNLPDGWGYRTPLRRMAGDSEPHRRKTCGDRSSDPFVPMPDHVPNDSCDEFPFAATHEGGRDGALCADILPKFENGQWQVYEARTDKPVKMTEQCVRGHVPLDDNRDAGGELGRFASGQRVLDTEKYTLTITN
ncbi:NucA/NucB deoxyribonuclease domain-containing protein [Streptomyces sp. NEAU-Y11]|uniref:NucA/NucB deoxyribonuclease domain-containing protein n=1 Tax=Streptomyces cucumeris TaxID=2962890 RepID=UPI0020C8FD20|nr:hypothetical protein [Streptomyces sp. NEAU-Y11]MCP9213385.1 hypothetical protein [Streptomyces sp. NEAU-Y11]